MKQTIYYFKRYNAELSHGEPGYPYDSVYESKKDNIDKKLAEQCISIDDDAFLWESNNSLVKITSESTLATNASLKEDQKSMSYTRSLKLEVMPSKKVPKDVMTAILNTVLTKCNIEALILSQKVNLPAPIPLPAVKQE